MQWVSHGYSLDQLEPIGAYSAPNHSSATENSEFVSRAVAELLASGAIIMADTRPTVVSPLGVVLRAEGKQNRLILDLRFVNSHLADNKFKYETLNDFAGVCPRGGWMVSFDLQSGYHHVEIDARDWQYLGFEWNGKYYVFRVLPFGLKPACWVFTRLMKCLVSKWRKQGYLLIAYIDDFLVCAASAERLRRQVAVLEDDFERAGLLLQLLKCKPTPTRQIEHLGFEIDTVRGVFIAPPGRWQRMQVLATTLVENRGGLARKVLSILGQIRSLSRALGKVQFMYTMHLQHAVSEVWGYRLDRFLRLGEDEVGELRFWASLGREAYTTPIWRNPTARAMTLFTDASATGWGAKCLQTGHTAADVLPAKSLGSSSTEREMLAVQKALQSLSGELAGSEVTVYTDSQCTYYILKKGGSPVPKLHELAISIYRLCTQNRIDLTAVWLERSLNAVADTLSRPRDKEEWRLKSKSYERVGQLLGQPDVDLFASSESALNPCFYSAHYCPGARGVDAFTANWASFSLPFINAPFHLMPRILAKLEADEARAILLVPVWTSRPWWPLLLNSEGQWRSEVRAALPLGQNRDVFYHYNPQFARACPRLGTVVALRIDFTGDKFQRYTFKRARAVAS